MAYTSYSINFKTNNKLNNFVDPTDIIIPTTQIETDPTNFKITTFTTGTEYYDYGLVSFNPSPTFTPFTTPSISTVDFNAILNLNSEYNLSTYDIIGSYQLYSVITNPTGNIITLTAGVLNGFYINVSFKSVNTFSVIMPDSSITTGTFNIVGSFNVYQIIQPYSSGSATKTINISTTADITDATIKIASKTYNVSLNIIEYTSIMTGTYTYRYTPINPYEFQELSINLYPQVFIPTQSFATLNNKQTTVNKVKAAYATVTTTASTLASTITTTPANAIITPNNINITNLTVATAQYAASQQYVVASILGTNKFVKTAP